MNIHTLPKTNLRKQKRLGRGHGSGRVKTSGRGTKGQKARGKIPPHFEGGQLSITRRLPLYRGKGRNHSQKPEVFAVSLSALGVFTKSSEVTLESLKKLGLVPDDAKKVKIIRNTEVKNALTVSVACSTNAKKSIEKAGGSVS